jgi:hypothetical protein
VKGSRATAASFGISPEAGDRAGTMATDAPPASNSYVLIASPRGRGMARTTRDGVILASLIPPIQTKNFLPLNQ